MTQVPYMDRFNASAWPEALQLRLGANAMALTAEADRLGFRAFIGHDLAHVARHQARFPDRMRLSPPFDPDLHTDHVKKDTARFISLEKDGVEVGICAARLFWVEGSFSEALRFKILPGSTIVTAPSAERLISSCPVAWSGGMHMAPGQPPEAFPLISRLLHLAVFVDWQWSWLAGMAEEAVMRRYGNKTYGFPMIEHGLWREGREYWLMLGPRPHYAGLLPAPSYADPAIPLGKSGEWSPT